MSQSVSKYPEGLATIGRYFGKDGQLFKTSFHLVIDWFLEATGG